MLKGIPKNIGSQLLKAMMDMGHGDTLVIADNFYPAISKTPNGTVCEAKGDSVTSILDSILQLMPLDTDYCDYPVKVISPAEYQFKPEIWLEIEQILGRREPNAKIRYIGREEFYKYARECFVTVSTGEERLFGCVIIQKGVI